MQAAVHGKYIIRVTAVANGEPGPSCHRAWGRTGPNCCPCRRAALVRVCRSAQKPVHSPTSACCRARGPRARVARDCQCPCPLPACCQAGQEGMQWSRRRAPAPALVHVVPFDAVDVRRAATLTRVQGCRLGAQVRSRCTCPCSPSHLLDEQIARGRAKSCKLRVGSWVLKDDHARCVPSWVHGSTMPFACRQACRAAPFSLMP